MRVQQLILTIIALVGFATPTMLLAYKGPDAGQPANNAERQQIAFRSSCVNAVSQIDMEINNVRARLTTGGDVWWDGNDGRYVVPKPAPGVDEVSSIFAGAVWLGGRDPGGGLKIAAQQYGRSGGRFDYYPGPLTDEGTTGADTCALWDKFFTVRGENIRQLRALYNVALELGTLPLDPNDISEQILGWPAAGNEFFFEIHGFDLPNTSQGFAGFWDENFDGIYDPTDGDYPIIEIRGCSETPQFPEEMTFWIYNDAGNVHQQSNTPTAIQMEIQVQAFAYTTADDINSMTFQRYKLINRAQEDILNTYFAMWVDPDLGCYTDDFVGCDTTRSLAYVYNEDELDGTQGCVCDQGVTTYCDEVPILGVDYFRGPIAPTFDPVTGEIDGEVELGMSSFIYMNNAGVGGQPPQTTDPTTADEYYGYLQGRWLDGSPLWNCGDGYDEVGCEETKYAFFDAPNDPNGWSMVTAELTFGDRRTLQASGPFTLRPGTVNELIVGVVWVPDQTYPNPSLQRLQAADDLAQALFNSCFDIFDGPDAPNVDLVELDREIILLLSNDRSSNNFEGNYEETGLGVPIGFDSLYRFEGYRVFQFSGPQVSSTEISNSDPNRVREIAQFDIDNNITKLFNWTAVEGEDNPLTTPYLAPELMVDGNDSGLRHSLRITRDAFASGNDTRLINHRRYYFAVIAYGQNNYKDYDPTDQDNLGQAKQYVVSNRNIGDRLANTDYYLGIPRPILDRELMSAYGDGAIVTRVAGQGNNGNFLDFTTEEAAEVAATFAAGGLVEPELTYAQGAGPIEVKVVDPRTVVNGDYEITFTDENMANTQLDEDVRWTLRCLGDCDLPTIISEETIENSYEQIISNYGFSITLGQVDEPGVNREGSNGAIGSNLIYENPDGPQWLTFLPDDFIVPNTPILLARDLFNYVNTGTANRFEPLDPQQRYSGWSPGVYPYMLMDQRVPESGNPSLSPVWRDRTNESAERFFDLARNRNVDIVFTSNKDLWTRCPVIETANTFYGDIVDDDGEFILPGDFPIMFDTRNAPSVTKEADANGMPVVEASPNPDRARGMGYFPGYAVDVETGERLQVFWGENSLYDGREIGDAGFTAQSNGADMIWNPSDVVLDVAPGRVGNSVRGLYNLVSGGQHYFYVTDLPYDEGEFLEGRLEPRTTTNRKVNAIREILYASFPLLTPGSELLSYGAGIIPNDVTLKLRVDNKFAYAAGTDDTNGYPTYRFSINDKSADTDLNDVQVNRALEMINVVPNPYYGFSVYEDNVFETNVKITNLPSRATVTIYSLDGKFIRKYERDEAPTMLRGGNRPVGERQISPALEWDLRNFRSIPVAGGVYLIHIQAPGLGERTLKWFGVQRQFDPSGL
jgi:hypothetical protein